MPKYPKIILGLLLIFLVLGISKVGYIREKVNPSFTLTAFQNSFNLKFNLDKTQKAAFGKALENLSLPSSVIEGVNFELDSTSSARLAFYSPISGTVITNGKQIKFTGSLDKEQELINFLPFKFPADLNLAIASYNLSKEAQRALNIPQKLLEQIHLEQDRSGQYLAFFDKGPQTVYIFKTNNFDTDSLKTITEEESSYKEEIQDGVKFFLIKNLAIFQLDNFTLVASSLDAAKKMVSAQKENEAVTFPQQGSNSYVLTFINSSKSPVSEDTLRQVFAKKEQIPTFVLKIEKLDLALKGDRFSGIMEIK